MTATIHDLPVKTADPEPPHRFAAFVARLKAQPGLYTNVAEYDPGFALFLAPFIRADAARTAPR